jgi:hypothetical protein
MSYFGNYDEDFMAADREKRIEELELMRAGLVQCDCGELVSSDQVLASSSGLECVNCFYKSA